MRLLRPSLLVSAVWAIGATPGSGGAQQSAPVLLRQFYGELALEVREAGGGALHIAAADSQRSVVVLLLRSDLSRWADTATRLLAVRSKEGRARALAEGPGVRGGSLSLTRVASAGKVTWTLFLADGDFASVQTPLPEDEVRSLVAALKRLAGGRGRRS